MVKTDVGWVNSVKFRSIMDCSPGEKDESPVHQVREVVDAQEINQDAVVETFNGPTGNS